MTEIQPRAPHVTDADSSMHVDAPRTRVRRDAAGVPVLHLEWWLQEAHGDLRIELHLEPTVKAEDITDLGTLTAMLRRVVRDAVDDEYAGRLGMRRALHLTMEAVDLDAIAEQVRRAWDEMPPAPPPLTPEPS